MNKYEPEYVSYKKRISKTIMVPILMAPFYFVLFYFFSYDDISLVFFTLILTIIFSITTSGFLRKNKRYLRSVSFDENGIELVIFEKDKMIINQTFLWQDVRIKVVNLYEYKYSRKFRLQIETLKNGKFETIINQYEIGAWNLDFFKKLYKFYCVTKGVYYNETSLQR